MSRLAQSVPLVLFACVKQLPPAPTPAAVAPPVQAPTPPAEGHGRLIIDVVDAPVAVQRIRMESKPVEREGHTAYRFFESPSVLCPRVPCVTDVPAGNLLLGFPELGDRGETEVELVHVAAGETSVYRRALSIYTDDTGGLRVFGIVSTSLGGAAAMTGVVLLPIGLAKDIDGMSIAGGITLGAGALLLAFGIWAINHDAPTYRPGSSNHFPLQ